jgi:hypothetical protein
MNTNSSMRSLIALGVDPLANAVTPDGEAVIATGWLVGPQGALLIRAAVGLNRRMEINSSEVGEYEYSVNDIHLPLDDLRAEPGAYLVNAAARGLRFAATMLIAAEGLPRFDALCGMVSVFVDTQDELFDLQDVTVRFSTRQGGYPDWLGDLERFEHHAVAVLDLGDARAITAS